MIWEGLSPPYRTIVADPPWTHRGSGNQFGAAGKARVAGYAIDSTPNSRYSTLTSTEVAALPVIDLAAKNAHLYLWTTNSDLPDAFAVVASWGFTYKTLLTWCKKGRIGLGAYFRGQTEHVLFGVRGSQPTLVNDELTYFTAQKGGHSAKPATFFDLVERSSPGPYVELFARQPRLGWDSWGYGYESSPQRTTR